MSLREFAVLAFMCLIWGLHFVVIKVAVAELPPIHYSAIRMLIVALLLARFLKWRPGQMHRVLGAGAALGGVNYAFMFSGVNLSTASASAVALQLYVPFATILSVAFLGEKVGWRRIGGMAMALAGVVMIAMQNEGGDGEAMTLGVILVVCGAFTEATGAILIKKSEGFKPIELLAWFAVVGTVLLFPLSFVVEGAQWSQFGDAPYLLSASLFFSAVMASIIGHTSYYWLLQRLPVSIVSPSALLATIIAVIASVILLGDPFTLQFALGGLMTLTGVGVIIFRSGRGAPASGARDGSFLRGSFSENAPDATSKGATSKGATREDATREDAKAETNSSP